MTNRLQGKLAGAACNGSQHAVTALTIAELPAHACINPLVIGPTSHRIGIDSL
jgi:hypothetical protein